MKQRTIRKIHPALRDDISDLRTQRPLPNRELQHLDPFLFLNHHGPQIYPPNNRGLPFGPHPHRGFETVTFIIEGSLTHHDTGGHESTIRAGGVQWMTAGRGLEHSELSPEEFLRYGGPLEILQLWVNLPARLKMTEPRYVGLQLEDIPVSDDGTGVKVSVIAGEWNGQDGPVAPLTDLFMSTVELGADAVFEPVADAGRTVFLYVVRGEVEMEARRVGPFNLIELNNDGERITIRAVSETLLLFGHAEAYNEPIAAQGPFVMNTEEEIRQAIRDYHAGAFRS